MSKHTPGPWAFYDDTALTGCIEIVALGKTVARIYRSVPEKDLPNARLIAAAPDLLEALRDAVTMIDSLNSAYGSEQVDSVASNGRAVIAKALGEQP